MITKETALEILEKPTLAHGIEKYKYIMNSVHATDVSKVGEFQKVYRDFYDLNTRFYSDEFAMKYFEIMEGLKGEKAVSFAMAFEKVKQIQDTYEISFSSKIVHTLDDNMPIWDSVVTKNHFGIKAPTYPKNREIKIVEKYMYYTEVFYRYLESTEGQMLIRAFDEKFPECGISDVKKIDFILWQDR